jgi:taurine dioxygenase
VLFFRDQKLSRDQHVAFGGLFGEVHIHPYARNLGPDHPEILEIQSDRIDGFLDWHVDATFERRPPIASILYGRETPPYGGDTLFASAAAAYDALSPVMQQCLEGLSALHTSSAIFGKGGSYTVDPASEQTTTSHPVVRPHPSNGRKVLYVNSQFTLCITSRIPASRCASLGPLVRSPCGTTARCSMQLSPTSRTPEGVAEWSGWQCRSPLDSR